MANSNSIGRLRGWFQQPLFQARFPVYTVPLALLALCILSYGLMLSKLGIHFDDWSLVWVIHFLGPGEFTQAYLMDRPLLGWLMALTTSLFGLNPLVWQIFGVIIRWLSCVALWWMLHGLWPRRSIEVVSIAFLFAVYPAFVSIHIPVTRAHHIVILALTLFSLGAMNWAVRPAFSPAKWFWPLYISSIITGALALFTMEYYFGLELLRPIFIWMILSEQIPLARKRLQKAVQVYFPYGLVMLSFLIWRVVTPTTRGSITALDKIQANPIAGLLEIIQTIFQDLIEASAFAWAQVFKPGDLLAGYDLNVILIYIFIVTGTALLSIIYLTRLEVPNPHSPEAASRRRRALQTILLGALALLLGGIPVWATNMHLELAFPWDRFTIAMMLGASMLLFGLLDLFTQKQWQLILITSVIVGLGAGIHFNVALSIRREWQSQKDFFWQMAWRAPGLQPGTAVLVSDLPFTYNNGYSLTAPLNWMYAPKSGSYELSYVLYEAPFYHEASDFLSLADKQGIPIHAENRMLFFNGSTSQAIYVIFRPPGCLKVVNPEKDQSLPEKPSLFRELLPLSDLSLIDPDPSESNSGAEAARPPAYFFGSEPEPGWCYYFEKADLARQMGDWQQVVELGDIALGDIGLSNSAQMAPKDYAEFIPFIIGYAHYGNWEKAFELSNTAYHADEKLRRMLCNTWETLNRPTSPDAQGQPYYDAIHQQLQCGS